MSRLHPAQLEVGRQHFVKELATDLQLSSSEHAILDAARAEMWLYWGVTVFAPEVNEVRVPVQFSREFFGEPQGALLGKQEMYNNQHVLDFRKGELAHRVFDLFLSSDKADQQRFTAVSRATARMALTVGFGSGVESEEFRSVVPMDPEIQLARTQNGGVDLAFRDTADTYPLSGPNERLAIINPGPTGAVFAAEVLGVAKEVHFLAGGLGGKFINSFNKLSLAAVEKGRETLLDMGMPCAPQDMAMLQAEPIKQHYYDRGVAKDGEHFTEPQSLDAVVMYAEQTDSVATCTAGVEMASRTLREGGIFVVKAANVALGNEVGIDEMAVIAQQSFGSPRATGTCGALAQHFNRNLPVYRPASYLLFEK